MRFFSVLMLICSISAQAEIIEAGQAKLFGTEHAFSVTAIPGWVMDNQNGAEQGLNMLFYPKDEPWPDSAAIVYGRSIPTSESADIKAQVALTLQDFHANGSPKYKSEHHEPLTLSNGKKAEIYLFSGDRWGNYEAAAYFQEKESINFLVLTTRSKEDFDKYFQDFKNISMSYQNLFKPTVVLNHDKLNSYKSEVAALLDKPEGKEYEAQALQASSNHMSQAMTSCSAALHNQDLPTFSYFARINADGSLADSAIFPASGLALCFNHAMSTQTYPTHSFANYLLKVEMKAIR